MKMLIIKEIEFDGDRCGPCGERQIALNTGESRCGLFGTILHGEGKPERCRECKQAEAQALEARKP